jgi:hypothetical protein
MSEEGVEEELSPQVVLLDQLPRMETLGLHFRAVMAQVAVEVDTLVAVLVVDITGVVLMVLAEVVLLILDHLF